MSYILAVDDDPDILAVVSLQLKMSGYEVVTAPSALDALRVLRENGPPLAAVVDVAMPELSGLDLVRIFRGRPDTAGLPVVFLSARVLASDVAAGEALGASYVTKPFKKSTLLDALDCELAGHPMAAGQS